MECVCVGLGLGSGTLKQGESIIIWIIYAKDNRTIEDVYIEKAAHSAICVGPHKTL